MQDASAKGRMQHGEMHYRAVLTEKEVRDIFATTGNLATVASKFGVSRMTVCEIRIGRTWNHVTGLPKKIRASRR
jgi:hypothetical protein